MSRRIRSIKPEVLEDEKAIALSDRAWRLWVSSWVLADDYGNLRAHDRYLAANVWQDTGAEVESARDELLTSGLWQPYAARGQRYVHIKGWDKHQRITNAGKQVIPGFEADDGSWGPSRDTQTSNQVLAAFFDHSRGEHFTSRGEHSSSQSDSRRGLELPVESAASTPPLAASTQVHNQTRGEDLSSQSDSPLRASPARAFQPPEGEMDQDPEGDREGDLRARARVSKSNPDSTSPDSRPVDPAGPNADCGATNAPQSSFTNPGDQRPVSSPKRISEHPGRSAGSSPSALTPPPDDIELTQSLKDDCVMSGWPEPTRDHVRAFLLNAKSKGQLFADWNARFKWWMSEERKRMGRRPFGSEQPVDQSPARKPRKLPYV